MILPVMLRYYFEAFNTKTHIIFHRKYVMTGFVGQFFSQTSDTVHVNVFYLSVVEGVGKITSSKSTG